MIHPWPLGVVGTFFVHMKRPGQNLKRHLYPRKAMTNLQPTLTKDNDIAGRVGTKFDLIELLDLDQDGDLDVITCEEVENLGVVWYENPAR